MGRRSFPGPDRTVHASYPGMEIVRYDRTGKWYFEPTLPGLSRQHVNIQQAVDQAVYAVENGGRVFLGLPGGGRFDFLYQKRPGKFVKKARSNSGG